LLYYILHIWILFLLEFFYTQSANFHYVSYFSKIFYHYVIWLYIDANAKYTKYLGNGFIINETKERKQTGKDVYCFEIRAHDCKYCLSCPKKQK